jgi:hypothetical protein
MSVIRKAGICCLIVLSAVIPAESSAQNKHQNIILEKSVDEYEFEEPRKGSTDFVLTHKVRNDYRCLRVSDSYVFGLVYDDKSEPYDFLVHVDEEKRQDIQPEFRTSGDAEYFKTRKICGLRIPFAGQGIKADLSFRQPFRDPRLSGIVSLCENLPLKSKTVIVHVPEWLDMRITEWNFHGKQITHTVDKRSRETVHTYEIRDYEMPDIPDNSVGGRHIIPHLVFEYHTARRGDEATTYFAETKDLYGYYHTLLDSTATKDSVVRSLAAGITKGLESDREKVQAIYRWVQSNVRYVAFEDGIAGFRPDKASSIIRKKYADCKGMSTLLVSMIRTLGMEASHCWIGTNDLPYDYSLHSMCVDNHMIAAWLDHGKPVYLDATANWIAFGDLREDIQGRQTLREDGSSFVVETLPMEKSSANLDLEQRNLKMEDGVLRGTVKHTLKGQSKYALLAALHALGNTNTDEVLKKYLSGRSPDYGVANIVTSDLSDRDRDLTITYDVVQRNAMNSFDNEIYLDVDNRKMAMMRLDTSKRRVPYLHDYKANCRLEVFITLPSAPGKCQLPDSVSLHRDDYGLAAGWRLQGNTLYYHAGYWTDNLLIPTAGFGPVNDDFDKLRSFYARQPELHF